MTRKLKSHEIACPLCLGQGRAHRDHLVLRWRSLEFEQVLQAIVDEEARCLIVDYRDVVVESEPWDVAVHIFDHDA